MMVSVIARKIACIQPNKPHLELAQNLLSAANKGDAVDVGHHRLLHNLQSVGSEKGGWQTLSCPISIQRVKSDRTLRPMGRSLISILASRWYLLAVDLPLTSKEPEKSPAACSRRILLTRSATAGGSKDGTMRDRKKRARFDMKVRQSLFSLPSLSPNRCTHPAGGPRPMARD